MSQVYDHPINRPRHQARCRAALEQYQQPGPQLPFERPRHYTDSRGRSYAWGGTHYVGID